MINVNPAKGGIQSKIMYANAVNESKRKMSIYDAAQIESCQPLSEVKKKEKKCCCCACKCMKFCTYCGCYCTKTDFYPKNIYTFLYPYMLIMWDGMGFFGFDDTKLARLRGIEVTFFSKFYSVRWVIFTLGSLIFALYILISEGSTYDNVKSRQISLI